MMVDYDKEYPGYGFASNKGYGTRDHYQGLEKFVEQRYIGIAF